MEIIKISGIALVAVVLMIFVTQSRSDFTVFIRIGVSIILMFIIAGHIFHALSGFEVLLSKMGDGAKWIATMLKLIGIAYIAEFTAEICRDAGENSIASRVELCAKILILVMAMPIMNSLIEMINKFM